MKKYRMGLTEEEQQELMALVSKEREEDYKQTHARTLLINDDNQASGPMKDQELTRALKVVVATMWSARHRVEQGVEAAHKIPVCKNAQKPCQLDFAGLYGHLPLPGHEGSPHSV